MNTDDLATKVAEAVAEERRRVMAHCLKRREEWVKHSDAMGSVCLQLWKEFAAGEHEKDGA